MTNEKGYVVDGKEFSSLLSIANEYNVRYPLLNYHAHKLNSVEKALDYILSEEYENNHSTYIVYGRTYQSITQVAVNFGISNRNLIAHNKRLGDLTKALEYCLGLEIEYGGKKYRNLCDLCSAYNISAGSCLGRLNSGWSLDRALSEPIIENNNVYKEVFFRGTLYNSVAALGRDYNIDSRVIYNIFEKYKNKYIGLNIEECCEIVIGFLEKYNIIGKFYINSMPSVLYDGNLFSTYLEYIKYIGIHQTLWYEYRGKYKGLDVLQTASLIKDKTIYNYEYQGECYSITEIKKLLGLSYHRVMTLVRHGKVRQFLVPKYDVNYVVSSKNVDLAVEFERYISSSPLLQGREIKYA